MHKNRLGERNYSILAVIFGLCGKTTANSHGGSDRLYPDLNEAALEKACDVYCNMPVIECSDEARVLRYLKSIDGGVERVGKCFDPLVENCGHQSKNALESCWLSVVMVLMKRVMARMRAALCSRMLLVMSALKKKHPKNGALVGWRKARLVTCM